MANLTNNITLQRRQNRYRLVVMNDDTFEELVTIKLNRYSVYGVLCATFVLLVGLTVALLIYTPLKYYIPGYGNIESTAQLQLLKIRTDSLEQSMHYKEQYIENVKKVLQGNIPLTKDTTLLTIPKNDQ